MINTSFNDQGGQGLICFWTSYHPGDRTAVESFWGWVPVFLNAWNDGNVIWNLSFTCNSAEAFKTSVAEILLLMLECLHCHIADNAGWNQAESEKGFFLWSRQSLPLGLQFTWIARQLELCMVFTGNQRKSGEERNCATTMDRVNRRVSTAEQWQSASPRLGLYDAAIWGFGALH